jgi:spore germination protein KC
LVTAVAIDKADSSNGYAVTVQIANPSVQSSGDNKSKETNSVWIGTEEGASIFEAVRKLANISSRRIMWAHNNVVIIGESLAKEGIIPVVDFFTHNPELRMKAGVVITKGNAKEYVSSKAGMESPSGVSFILLESFRALSAVSVKSHMLQVSGALKNEYANPLISVISLKEATMQSAGDGAAKGESSETIDLGGSAVFKKDKMIGWLSPEETRGAAWILNQTKNTIVTVTDPDHENKAVAVETKSVKAKIKTKVFDGMPSVLIKITGKGDIVEEDGSTKQNIGEVKTTIADLVNKKIEEEIKSSLETIQKKYKVDVLEFAQIVHAQNDIEWESGLKDKWQEVFPQIPVNVSVDIRITSSVLNQEPLKAYK